MIGYISFTLRFSPNISDVGFGKTMFDSVFEREHMDVKTAKVIVAYNILNAPDSSVCFTYLRI